jgi:hypothetical protein
MGHIFIFIIYFYIILFDNFHIIEVVKNKFKNAKLKKDAINNKIKK